MLTPCCFPSLARFDSASRTDAAPQLTDEQWFLIEELFPWEPPHRPGGRPPIPPRPCFEALLWLLRNGGRWQDLPKSGPSKSTLQRRLAEWTNSGILTEVWSRLVDLADELGWIDWHQLLADGTFCPAKKGAHWSPPVRRERARRFWC
jgi:transposase